METKIDAHIKIVVGFSPEPVNTLRNANVCKEAKIFKRLSELSLMVTSPVLGET